MRKLLINLIIAAGSIALFTSCNLTKPQVVYVNRDSVVTTTEVVYKDTIITIPGDTVRFQIPCDKDTVYIVKGKSSTSMVAVNKGKVTVQNNCDQKDLIITKLREQIDHMKLVSSDSLKTVTITVKHTPAAVRFFAWGFWVLLALATGLFLVNKNIWVLLISTIGSLVKAFKKKK